MTTTAAPARGGRLGLAQASALYIAAVLGTGILVLPGLAADAAGPASVLAVAAVLLVSIPLAGTFAALAARHPDAGGVATFVRLALGATAARAAGFWFFFGVGFGAPVVAMLGAGYLASVAGIDPELVPLLGMGFLAVAIVINIFGVRVSGTMQLGLSVLLVVVIVGVLLIAAPTGDPARFTPFLPHGWTGVAQAVNLFVWAVAGWEAVTHIAGEFRNPSRTIPLATAIAVVVVAVTYLALQLATVAVLGAGGGSGAVPFIDLVAVGAPGWGPVVVAGIAVVVTIGVLNAYVPAFAKLAASLGRDGHLPRWFAVGAADGEIPRRGLALTGALTAGYFAVFIVFRLELSTFILFHTASMVAVYLLGTVAALRLLRRGSVGWWMALVSVILSAVLLVLAGGNLIVPAVLALIAVAVTVVRRFRRERVRSS